jgi:hypothetical protein
MAVAAPARKTAPAPAPSRKTPPLKSRGGAAAPAKPAPSRKRPLRPTRSRVTNGTAAPARKAPARKSPSRKAPARKAPSRKPATGKAAAPARKAAPRKAATRRAPAPNRARSTAQRAVAGGQLIPIAVGRTAVAVSQLPDSGLVVRLTRGRAWIAVLGVLLVGIVALNVVTLSFAASSGEIDEHITTLEQESSILRGRDARLSGIAAVRNAAAPLGLTMPNTEEIHVTEAGPGDVATAAARLAAAGP